MNGPKLTKESKKKKKFVLLSEKKRKSIMKDYNDITGGLVSFSSCSVEKLSNALNGMYLKKEKISKKEMYDEIMEVYKNNQNPIIHEDSLTAWSNNAVINYGLEIQDITKMKFGDKLDVVLMDRNVGDYTQDFKVGKQYDPLTHGFSYATYIHGKNLTGMLFFKDINEVRSPFTWEINGTPYGKSFWTIVGSPDECEEKVDISKYDKKTKIGWRGPAVTVENAKKYLPRKVTHYETWWNDYTPYLYDDFLNKK
jgi:hypothetical protein